VFCFPNGCNSTRQAQQTTLIAKFWRLFWEGVYSAVQIIGVQNRQFWFCVARKQGFFAQKFGN
jgi:hypothetical protein